jgi:hypothetical protein
VTVAFGWRRDDLTIPGVTTDHLTLTEDDAGHSIRCAVTGTTDLGSIITLSPPVSVLAAPARGDGATAVPAPSAPSVVTPPGAASAEPVDAPAGPTLPAIAVLASSVLAPAAQHGSGRQTTPARGARLLLSRPVHLRAGGRLPFAVACSSARGCVGSLTLRARGARAHAPGVRVGSVAFRLRPQSRRTITLTLTAAGRRLFGSQRRRTLLVTLTERARGQNLPPVTRAVVVVDA